MTSKNIVIYELDQERPINRINIAMDCITIYYNDKKINHITIPIKNNETVIPPMSAPFLFTFLNEYNWDLKEQNPEKILLEMDQKMDTPFQDCYDPVTQSNLIDFDRPSDFDMSSLKDILIRHSLWHNNNIQETARTLHGHFATSNSEPITEKQIECLLNKYVEFGEKSGKDNLLLSEEVKEIITTFRENKNEIYWHDMSMCAISSFVQTVFTSFLLDLMGRYALPAFLYHSQSELITQHANKILFLGKSLLPIYSVYQTINQSFVTLAISLLSMTLISLGKNYFPTELASFLKFIKTLLTEELTEKTAKLMGKELGIFVGGTSAKATGKSISQLIIKTLPKLKKEGQSEKVSTETETQHEHLHRRKLS